jgi:hypothetical protein
VRLEEKDTKNWGIGEIIIKPVNFHRLGPDGNAQNLIHGPWSHLLPAATKCRKAILRILMILWRCGLYWNISF